MSNILDSGERREFETGAVRDISKGKGRCDLLPLDIAAHMLEHLNLDPVLDHLNLDPVLYHISKFSEVHGSSHLYDALFTFGELREWSIPTMLLEVSKHFEGGAAKYGEYNWQKGLPIHCYIDSGVRHYLKWLAGETDEPHDRAFVWNIMACLWTLKHRPHLMDLRTKETNDEPFETSQTKMETFPNHT